MRPLRAWLGWSAATALGCTSSGVAFGAVPAPTGEPVPKATANLEHIATWRSKTDEGKRLLSQGKLKEAEACLSEALQAALKGFARDMPHVGMSANNMAEIYRVSGKLEEARWLYYKAMECFLSCYGEEDPRSALAMHNYAVALGMIGDHKDAHLMAKRAYLAMKAVLGSERTETLQSHYLVARTEWNLRHRRRAIQTAKDCAAILLRRDQKTMENGQLACDVLCLLLEMKDQSVVPRLWEFISGMLEEAGEGSLRQTLQICEKLIDAFVRVKLFEEALEVAKRLMTFIRGILSTDNIALVLCHRKEAEIFLNMPKGSADKALELAVEAVNMAWRLFESKYSSHKADVTGQILQLWKRWFQREEGEEDDSVEKVHLFNCIYELTLSARLLSQCLHRMPPGSQSQNEAVLAKCMEVYTMDGIPEVLSYIRDRGQVRSHPKIPDAAESLVLAQTEGDGRGSDCRTVTITQRRMNRAVTPSLPCRLCPAAPSTRPRLLRTLRSARSVPEIVDADKTDSEKLVENVAAFLKEDLPHLFDDQGIDATRYDDVVDFQDPVTSYSSIQGYLFNIRLLRSVFDPTFTLHEIRQTGEYELTARWTMEMSFTPASKTALKSFWNPELTFTGVSIYGLNPDNGKINKHIDLWDAVDNQQFPSPEAFFHVFQQLLDTTRVPDLESPPYTVLKRMKAYEIRRYPPFFVAETRMSSAQGMTEFNPASSSGGSAFSQLAGYIFGNNKEKEKMEMTTPVLTDTTGNMQFVLGSKFKDVTDLPTPEVGGVEAKEAKGGLFACLRFRGAALEGEVTQEHAKLEKIMQKDRLVPGKDWILARYNDPFTNPLVRRNEILIPIDRGFQLW